MVNTKTSSKVVEKTTVHSERQSATVQPISVAAHMSESTRKLPTIHVQDRNLHKYIEKAEHGVDEVIAKRQEQARLKAAELHEKEVLNSVTEIEHDTHHARKELQKKAEEHEHKVLKKMDEVKVCAKTMMKEAKHQVEEYEHEKDKVKSTGCFGKLAETFKSSKTEVKEIR